ncbi:hypothetical protein IWX50DRAFT_119123 [Phyllosticta citricarpa]
MTINEPVLRFQFFGMMILTCTQPGVCASNTDCFSGKCVPHAAGNLCSAQGVGIEKRDSCTHSTGKTKLSPRFLKVHQFADANLFKWNFAPAMPTAAVDTATTSLNSAPSAVENRSRRPIWRCRMLKPVSDGKARLVDIV